MCTLLTPFTGNVTPSDSQPERGEAGAGFAGETVFGVHRGGEAVSLFRSAVRVNLANKKKSHHPFLLTPM
jgi:hypothetical protein